MSSSSWACSSSCMRLAPDLREVGEDARRIESTSSASPTTSAGPSAASLVRQVAAGDDPRVGGEAPERAGDRPAHGERDGDERQRERAGDDEEGTVVDGSRRRAGDSCASARRAAMSAFSAPSAPVTRAKLAADRVARSRGRRRALAADALDPRLGELRPPALHGASDRGHLGYEPGLSFGEARESPGDVRGVRACLRVGVEARVQAVEGEAAKAVLLGDDRRAELQGRRPRRVELLDDLVAGVDPGATAPTRRRSRRPRARPRAGPR